MSWRAPAAIRTRSAPWRRAPVGLSSTPSTAPSPPSTATSSRSPPRTPWPLTGARLDGVRTTLGTERELGRWVYSTFVVIPAGAAARLELDLQGRLAPGRRREGYRLTVTVDGATVRRDVVADTMVRPRVRG